MQEFLYHSNIVTMACPDLNPIEHLWDKIEHRIHRCHVLPATVQELTDAVLDA